jgi:hypothetical protein
MDEVAEKLSAATGSDPLCERRSEEARSAQLAAGVPPVHRGRLTKLFAERARKEGVAQVWRVIEEILDRPPTSFDEFATRNAAIFRGEQPAPKV